MPDSTVFTLAHQFPQVAHSVGISGVPVFELGAMQHIQHLSAHLSAANEQILLLRQRVADLEALLRAKTAAASAPS